MWDETDILLARSRFYFAFSLFSLNCHLAAGIYAGAIISLCVVKKSRIEEVNANQGMIASFIESLLIMVASSAMRCSFEKLLVSTWLHQEPFALGGGDTILNHQSPSGSLQRAETRFIRCLRLRRAETRFTRCLLNEHWTKRRFTSWPENTLIHFLVRKHP